MDPYRISSTREMILSNKPPKLRTFRRKFLIFLYGTFLERKPDKCQECGKRSNGIGSSARSYILNHYDCGHRRYPGLWVTAS